MLQNTGKARTIEYIVTVDGHSLGAFSTCEGLAMEIVLESREEGGVNTAIWQLPTRVKYPNVKLTRPLGVQTKDVVKWLSTVGVKVSATTASIQARTTEGVEVVRWDLQDVVPVRWQGPSLAPDATKVFTETLELAHHGLSVK